MASMAPGVLAGGVHRLRVQSGDDVVCGVEVDRGAVRMVSTDRSVREGGGIQRTRAPIDGLARIEQGLEYFLARDPGLFRGGVSTVFEEVPQDGETGSRKLLVGSCVSVASTGV